jgi:hypothetical protein
MNSRLLCLGYSIPHGQELANIKLGGITSIPKLDGPTGIRLGEFHKASPVLLGSVPVPTATRFCFATTQKSKYRYIQTIPDTLCTESISAAIQVNFKESSTGIEEDTANLLFQQKYSAINPPARP